jgi:hydrogenase 3 maturation protease
MSDLLTDNVKDALLPAPEGVTLIIMVGNALRRDDGAGPYIFNHIQRTDDRIRLMNVADRPEDSIDEAVALAPVKTVIIDAADFGGAPGEARIIPQEQIPDSTLSTHTFPLKIITGILEEDTGSEVFFLGIQPADISWGEGLTAEVKKTADTIIGILEKGERHA